MEGDFLIYNHVFSPSKCLTNIIYESKNFKNKKEVGLTNLVNELVWLELYI